MSAPRAVVRFIRVFLVAATALCVLPATGSGQVTRADSAEVLLHTAVRFEREGRLQVADALYRLITEDYGDTSAAGEARRRLAGPADRRVTRSGQVELQVWATTFGAWLGVAIPSAFGSGDSEAYGTGLLLGGPAGFLSARALAKHRTLSSGQARAITLGGTWGTWQGYGWSKVLDLGQDEVCSFDYCYTGGDDTEETMASMIVGGLAGIAVGTALSHRTIPAGVATTVNFGSLWGTWFGFALSYLMDLEGDALLAGTLLGGDAGLVTTAFLAPGWHFSRNRARVISIAGVIGALAGMGVDLIAQPGNDRVAVAIPLVTSAIGLWSGIRGTRAFDGPSGPPGPNPAHGPGALLSWVGGSVRLGAPVPFPRLVPSGRSRGPTWEPVLGVTLFQAVF